MRARARRGKSSNDRYLSGWESGCNVVFDESPDGSLYDQGDEYTVDDCYGLAPSMRRMRTRQRTSRQTPTARAKSWAR
jgi:hypothetical protein